MLKNYRFLLPSLLTLCLVATPVVAASVLSNPTVIAALKEALSVGTQRVVADLGKTDGFNKDTKIHIPLPATLQKVDTALTMVGMGQMTDDLELRINRSAEAAMPKAKTLFIDAIKQMTITDAQAILMGPDDAATQYLKKSMSPGLAKEMQPLIQKTLAESGAIKSYDQVMGKYATLPLVSSAKTNLNNYVIDKTLSGMFYYVAQEEIAIRNNPAERTTALLKKVFSTVQ
jgi:hypothetical protein